MEPLSRRFSLVLGNPPYQIVTGDSKKTATLNTVAVYPVIQEIASSLGVHTSLVYPASWQKDYPEKLGGFLRKNGLKKVVASMNGQEFFGEHITFGYSISVAFTALNFVGPMEVQMVGFPKFYLPRESPLWLTSSYRAAALEATSHHPKLTGGVAYLTRLTNLQEACTLVVASAPEGLRSPIGVYIKRTPGKAPDSDTYYVEEEAIRPHLVSDSASAKWKVVMRQSMLGRQSLFHKDFYAYGSLRTRVLSPKNTAGETLCLLRMFDTEREARNFSAYLNTRFCLELAELDYSRGTFGSHIPDLLDYTDANETIDFTRPLDAQLNELFNLDPTFLPSPTKTLKPGM